MDAKTINNIRNQIARQFPEVAKSAPSVKAQAAAKSRGAGGTYLLTFKGRVSEPGGFKSNRTVRVVAQDNGRILKVSTSR